MQMFLKTWDMEILASLKTMDGQFEKSVVKAITEGILISQKPYLTLQEVMLYINKGRTATHLLMKDYGIKKSSTGYYSRSEIDNMLAGGPTYYEQKAAQIKIRLR